MEFEWDEEKAAANLKKHSVDFYSAVEAFKDNHALIIRDTRLDYGEQRYAMIAAIEHRPYVIIFTMRNDIVRVISARKANERERKQYADSQTQH